MKKKTLKVREIRKACKPMPKPVFRDYPKTYEGIYGDKYATEYNKKYRFAGWFMLGDEWTENRDLGFEEAFRLASIAQRDEWDSHWLFICRNLWLKRRFHARKKTGEFVRLYTHDPKLYRDQYFPFTSWRRESPRLYGTHPMTWFAKQWMGVISYVPDWYRGFDDMDPFGDPESFRWPFRFVSPEMAALVFKMEERLDILELAESSGFNYFEFTDWLLNWIGCYNDEVGKKVYSYYPADDKNSALVSNNSFPNTYYASWRIGTPSDEWGPDRDWLRKIPGKCYETQLVLQGARSRSTSINEVPNHPFSKE